MKKILLACAAGLSTSMMVEIMKKVCLKRGIDAEIWAEPVSQAIESINKVDVILLGPQVRYELKNFENYGDKTIVKVIDTKHYGTMNGDAVIDSILEYIS